MFSLGNFLQLTHHFDGAEKMYEKAVDLYTRASQLLKVADVKCRISRLWKFNPKMDKESEVILKQAMNIYEKEKGQNAVELVVIINQIATIYETNGRYREAEEILLRGQRIGTQLGNNNSDFATTLYHLGCVYVGLFEFDKAEELLAQSLKIFTTNLGEWDPEVSRVLNRLGSLYTETVRYEEASKCLLRAKEIRVQKLGAESSRVAQSLRHLVTLYESKEEYNKAIEACSQAINIMKKRFGDKHSRVVPIMKRLGSLYWVSGNLSLAKDYVKSSADIEKELGVPNDELEDTLKLLKNIGNGPHYLMSRSNYVFKRETIETKKMTYPYVKDINSFDKRNLNKVLIREYNPREASIIMVHGKKKKESFN